MKNKMVGKISALTMVATMALGGFSVYAGESESLRNTQPHSTFSRVEMRSMNLENLEDWQRAELEKLYEEANLLRNRILEKQKEHGLDRARFEKIGLALRANLVGEFSEFELGDGVLAVRAKMSDLSNQEDWAEKLTHARQAFGERIEGIPILRAELSNSVDMQEFAERVAIQFSSENERQTSGRRVELANMNDIGAIIGNFKASGATHLINTKGEVIDNLTDEKRADFNELSQEFLELSTRILEKKYEFGMTEISGERINNILSNVSSRELIRN